MKIPLSWLRDYIDIEMSPHQIAHTLTMLGLEVDAVDQTELGFTNVVVATVTKTEKHPNADSLTVATVFDGTETLQVVCGAPNCRAGMKTALARVGAVLKDEKGKAFNIKQASLRGVDSFGMLCSASELGLSDKSDGIIEFSAQVPEGTDVAGMYGDSIFDISLTPNLGFCHSVYGVARELAAGTGLPLKPMTPQVHKTEGHPPVKIQIDQPEQCRRYTCRQIDQVKVGPSPEWLQRRIESCGLRSINNIVDITNYILLALGQPLHAFDRSKLQGDTIYVRNARNSEKFLALDGVEYVLEDKDIAICDDSGVVALGGVMGGDSTKVTDDTTSILLECAYFEPASIRRTSKRLNLLSDASKRFEKGCDPEALDSIVDYAAHLIAELSGGKVVGGIGDAYPGKQPQAIITCRLARINNLLGIILGSGEVEAIFERLFMHAHWDGPKESFHVKIPSYRHDVKEEVDLIEEVARIYGYANIPRISVSFSASNLPDTPFYLFENEVRQKMTGQGLQEFLTCDLISPALVDWTVGADMPPDTRIEVMNPSSVEQSILRQSLLPGLLQVVKYNLDHQSRDIHGFEVGRVHYKDGERYIDQSTVGVVLSGIRRPLSWDEKSPDCDFFDLKGIVENLLDGISIPKFEWKISALKALHPGRQASVFIGEAEVGTIGEVHPSVLKKFDIPHRVYFAELNLHLLIDKRQTDRKMVPLPIYPGSERDWTVTVSESLPVQMLFDQINGVSSRLLESLSLVALFRGGNVPQNHKNVTLRFFYRDNKKTISQEAVELEHSRILNTVQRYLSGV